MIHLCSIIVGMCHPSIFVDLRHYHYQLYKAIIIIDVIITISNASENNLKIIHLSMKAL